MGDALLMEQAVRLEATLPGIARRLFTLDPSHPVTDMPLGQLRVCSILQDGPQPPGCLADRLGITSSAVTQIADRLVRAGYVERVPEADDRRVRRLRLTDTGARLMRTRRNMRTKRAAEALARMPEEERAGLLRSLEALERAAGAADESLREDPSGVRQAQ